MPCEVPQDVYSGVAQQVSTSGLFLVCVVLFSVLNCVHLVKLSCGWFQSPGSAVNIQTTLCIPKQTTDWALRMFQVSHLGPAFKIAWFFIPCIKVHWEETVSHVLKLKGLECSQCYQKTKLAVNQCIFSQKQFEANGGALTSQYKSNQSVLRKEGLSRTESLRGWWLYL